MIETHELNGTVFSKNDCLNYTIKIIFYTCQSYIYYPISLSHGILFYSTFFFEKHIFRKLCLNYHQIFITINVTYIYINFSWNTLFIYFFGNTCSEIFVLVSTNEYIYIHVNLTYIHCFIGIHSFFFYFFWKVVSHSLKNGVRKDQNH